MSTSSFPALALTPEQLNYLTTPQDIEPELVFHSAMARSYDRCGLTPRAKRIETCGDKGRIRYCDKGHYLRTEIGYCMCRFGCCRERTAEVIVKRWMPAIEHIRDNHPPIGRLVYIEIRFPRQTRDASNVKSRLNRMEGQIIDLLESAVKCQTIGSDPFWRHTPGYDKDTLVVRILVDDPYHNSSSTIPTDRWKSLWPDAQVSVKVAKASEIESWFRRLVRPLPIKDPDDCAEQEAMFQGMQLFRANNTKHICVLPPVSEQGELSVGDNTDNSVEVTEQAQDDENKVDTPHSHAKRGCKCPICGAPANNLTMSMRLTSPQYKLAMSQFRGSPPS